MMMEPPAAALYALLARPAPADIQLPDVVQRVVVAALAPPPDGWTGAWARRAPGVWRTAADQFRWGARNAITYAAFPFTVRDARSVYFGGPPLAERLVPAGDAAELLLERWAARAAQIRPHGPRQMLRFAFSPDDRPVDRPLIAADLLGASLYAHHLAAAAADRLMDLAAPPARPLAADAPGRPAAAAAARDPRPHRPGTGGAAGLRLPADDPPDDPLAGDPPAGGPLDAGPAEQDGPAR